MIGYRVAFDPSLWIDVPLDFPAGDFADADEWAQSVSESAQPEGDDSLETRAWLYRTVRTAAEYEMPLAHRRFLYFPVAGGLTTVAHLYAVERSEFGDASLATIAGADGDSLTYPVVENIQTARAGLVVRVLTTMSVASDGAETQVAARVRIAREIGPMIFVLEVIDGNLGRAALILEDLTALIEAVDLAEIAM